MAANSLLTPSIITKETLVILENNLVAAGKVIACADNIVPVGVISPDHIGTPAPVVDYLVANT